MQHLSVEENELRTPWARIWRGLLLSQVQIFFLADILQPIGMLGEFLGTLTLVFLCVGAVGLNYRVNFLKITSQIRRVCSSCLATRSACCTWGFWGHCSSWSDSRPGCCCACCFSWSHLRRSHQSRCDIESYGSW